MSEFSVGDEVYLDLHGKGKIREVGDEGYWSEWYMVEFPNGNLVHVQGEALSRYEEKEFSLAVLRQFTIYEGADERDMFCIKQGCYKPFHFTPGDSSIGMFLDAANRHMNEYHPNGE